MKRRQIESALRGTLNLLDVTRGGTVIARLLHVAGIWVRGMCQFVNIAAKRNFVLVKQFNALNTEE